MSANKPTNQAKGVITTSGSSRDPSDEDDEAGPCEQSTNPIDMKRLRRYINIIIIIYTSQTLISTSFSLYNNNNQFKVGLITQLG